MTTDTLTLASARVRDDLVLAPAARAAIATTPAQILERWFAALSKTARRKYQRTLTDFATWATGDPTSGPTSAMRLLVDVGCSGAHQLAKAWRDHLLARGLASGTVAGFISSLGSLVRAAREAGAVQWSLERCAPKAEARHDRRGPGRGDVERLVAHLVQLADDGDVLAVRDLTIVRLLHNAALRRSEVLQLTIDDLDLDGDVPAVNTRRKGYREQKRVAIGAIAAESLRRWLAVRGAGAGCVFLRCRQRTDLEAITGEAVRRMLRTRAAEAGVRAVVRPHGLRHSSATEVLKRGSIAELQALGGWRTLTAAAHYVDAAQTTRTRAVALVEL